MQALIYGHFSNTDTNKNNKPSTHIIQKKTKMDYQLISNSNLVKKSIRK